LAAGTRVNARTSKKEQLLHPAGKRSDDIVLDLEVLVDERRRLRVVRADPADLAAARNTYFGLSCRKAANRRAVEQVEFSAGATMTCETLTLEFAPDGAAHQAAVAGDEDSGAGLKVIAHSES